ncbi:MAG: hypothetical protein KAX15_07680 [Candidatus Omnitrophica bacterium]|nr:hypothetical protein [Candidatus Omnitrophota bacterium]
MLINLDIKTALALYTLVPAALLIGVWIIAEFFNKPLRFTLEEKLLWQCDICAYVYINIEETNLSVCPRCGSYNKKTEPDKEIINALNGEEGQKETGV